MKIFQKISSLLSENDNKMTKFKDLYKWYYKNCIFYEFNV